MVGADRPKSGRGRVYILVHWRCIKLSLCRNRVSLRYCGTVDAHFDRVYPQSNERCGYKHGVTCVRELVIEVLPVIALRKIRCALFHMAGHLVSLKVSRLGVFL